jgi:hypothetical protein
MSNPAQTPATLKARIITQAIAIVCFLVLPVIITLVVPFTDLEFRHTGAGASVTVKRYVLTFIPWQTHRIDHVREVRAQVTSGGRYGDSSENRRLGRDGAYRYPTGQLVIVSAGPERIVQASPDKAEAIAAQFGSFANDRNAQPVRISVYASWGLSYVLGGIATFFAALYLFGAAASGLQFLLRQVRGKAANR